MSDSTIDDFKHARLELELQVLDLLSNFEKKFSCHVKFVELATHELIGASQPEVYSVKISTEL